MSLQTSVKYMNTLAAYDYAAKQLQYNLNNDTDKDDFDKMCEAFKDNQYQFSIVDRIKQYAQSDYYNKTDVFFPLLESILVKDTYVSDKLYTRADLCTKEKLVNAMSEGTLKELLVSMICGYYDTSDEDDALAQDEEIAHINYYLCLLESLDPTIDENLDVSVSMPNAVYAQVLFHPYAGFEKVTFAQIMKCINAGTHIIDVKSNVIKRISDGKEIGFFVHYEAGFSNTKVEELLNNEFKAESTNEINADPIESAEAKTCKMKIDDQTGDSIEYDWENVEIVKQYPEIKIFGYNSLINDTSAYESAMVSEAANSNNTNTSKIDNYNPPTASAANQGWKQSVSKWFDEKKIDNHPMDNLVTG